MNKEEMINVIYEKVANKELIMGCKMYSQIAWKNFILVDKNKFIINVGYVEKILELNWQEEIIWHPVLIWDILDYIDKNAELFAKAKHINWGIEVDLKAREWYVIWLYNYFIWRHRLIIEKQTEECIKYIYNLIK